MDPFLFLFISFLSGILLGGLTLNMAIYVIAKILEQVVEFGKLCFESVRIPEETETVED